MGIKELKKSREWFFCMFVEAFACPFDVISWLLYREYLKFSGTSIPTTTYIFLCRWHIYSSFTYRRWLGNFKSSGNNEPLGLQLKCSGSNTLLCAQSTCFREGQKAIELGMIKVDISLDELIVLHDRLFGISYLRRLISKICWSLFINF